MKNTVLLVDDDSEFLGLMAQVVGLVPHLRPAPVSDPRLALDLIPFNQPLAIVTDTNMPVMSGIDLLQITQQFYPDTPVIVLFSGLNNSPITASQIVEMGAHAVMSKTEVFDLLIPVLLRLAHEKNGEGVPPWVGTPSVLPPPVELNEDPQPTAGLLGKKMAAG